jgi:dihydrolipoamide dehydrogenase
VAIANGLTVDQLRLPIRPHPTFEEAMGDALADLKKKLG